MSKKVLAVVVGTIIGGTFLCLALWVSSRSPTAPVVPEPQYRIISDVTKYDDRRRAQVEMSVMIEGLITESSLRRLLDRVYAEVMQRGPFKAHAHPNYVFLYVHAKEGQSWIAMAQKTPSSDLEVQVRDKLMATANVPSETKFGFSEVERQAIFKDYVRAEDRGNLDAEKEFPDLAPGRLSDFKLKKYRELKDKYATARKATRKAALAASLHLTLEQLGDIRAEGMDEHWELPKAPAEWR